MSDSNTCPICACSEFSWISDDGYPTPMEQRYPELTVMRCGDCGKVYLYPHVLIHLRDNQDLRFKMACLLYERKLQGKSEPIAFYTKDHGRPTDTKYSCYECSEWINSFPSDPLEKIDRTLLNIQNEIKDDLSVVVQIQSPDSTGTTTTRENTTEDQEYDRIKLLYSKNLRDALGLATLMQELEYVKYDPNRIGFQISITAHGWQRISELRDQQAENSETCFVAMAFNNSTEKYREAVREAVKRAGYRADVIAVDEAEHNNFIMDEVINMINESRFVIADFTTLPEEDKKEAPKVWNGVRGGVYWEAGYARGQNKQVIHTCRKEKDSASKRRLHFDVEQINTLFWTEEEIDKFTRNLTERIKATVGKGPLPIS